jgi:DNA-binding transcriptional MerR regulator
VEVGVAVTRGDDGDRPSSRVSAAVGSQGTLFDDSEVPGLPGEPGVSGQPGAAGPSGFSDEPGADSSEVGYRGPIACAAAGITYRQLDYWARTALVEPSVRAAHGSGSQRLYSFRDILVLKVVKRLLDTGISLQQIRAAVQHLRDRGSADLAQVTLMSDGVSVYECTTADEVVDLLQGGQGVFGIALGRVWREVEGDLAVLPAVRAEDGFVAVASGDHDDLAKSR